MTLRRSTRPGMNKLFFVSVVPSISTTVPSLQPQTWPQVTVIYFDTWRPRCVVVALRMIKGLYRLLKLSLTNDRKNPIRLASWAWRKTGTFLLRSWNLYWKNYIRIVCLPIYLILCLQNVLSDPRVYILFKRVYVDCCRWMHIHISYH